MEIKYTSEKDFKTVTHEYPDEMMEIIDNLFQMEDQAVGPVMSTEGGKELVFGVNLGEDRLERELCTRAYRIAITKVVD